MKFELLCVLFSFISLSVGSALNESLTYDEVFYLAEGRSILTGGVARDPYNPPLMPIVNGIPIALGLDALVRSERPMDQAFPARMVTIALGSVLVVVTYIVGTRVFGSSIGLVAAFLLAFNPNILAHSHYVTTDIGVTLFFFLAIGLSIRFLARPTRPRSVLLGLAIGYAVGAKITSLVFIACTTIAILWQEKGPRSWKWIVKQRGVVLLGIIVTLVFLWAVYFFRSDLVIAERPDEHRVSSRLMRYAESRSFPILAQSIAVLRTVPVPLGGFIALLKNNAIRAVTPRGERGVWYGMLGAVAVKTPIPLILLFIVGLCTSGKLAEFKKRRLSLFVTIPIIILTVSIGLGFAPLVRFALPMYPFVAIVAGASINYARTRRMRSLLVILLLWYAWGTIGQYPHFISYANALGGPREKRYQILYDSNLDWGQALPDLARYVQTQKIGNVTLSYFGRDDENEWRFEEICAFQDKVFDPKLTKKVTVISVSNWYYCGYNKEEAYRKEYIWDVVADSLLVF